MKKKQLKKLFWVFDMLQSKHLLEYKGISHFFFDAEDNLLNFGINDEEVYYPNQIHSDRLIYLNKMDKIYDCDGVITKAKICIGIKTADCLPVFFYESNQKIAAVVHAGWRGVLSGIVSNAISMIVEYGGNPDKIVIAVGPHIKSCCYEVSGEVACKFEENFGGIKCTEYKGSEIFLNLDRAVLSQMEKSGVSKKNIEILDYCTFHNSNFFSYRRNKTKDRMKSIIKLN